MSGTQHRRPRRRRCPWSGKRRFSDHNAAVTFLRFASNARAVAEESEATTTHRAVRAYPCATCRGWHVTSAPATALEQVA